MKYWLSALWCLFMIPVAYGQQKKTMMNEPYAKEFRQVDSLLNEAGLPQSAQKILKKIYDQAKVNNQPVQQLKAQLYLLTAARSEEGADTGNIALAVREAKESTFPYDHVWHSIAAQLYFNYYQQHRWQIMPRTALSAESKQPLTEWDAAHFFRVIAKHYDASLEDEAGLRKIDLAIFSPVLEGNTDLRKLRPTLFDLLAFRAVDYYTNDEKDLTQPAYKFTIDDPAYLADAGTFITQRLTSRDTQSMQLRALQLYQEILRLHINDAAPDALIDADLQRLLFVYSHGIFTDRKYRYYQALKRIADQHATHKSAAEALYRMAALKYEDDLKPADKLFEPGKTKRDVNAIRAALMQIVQQYPGSEGAIHAQELLSNIDRTELSLQSEEVVLPDEYSKVLLTYRNVPRVWGRVLRLSEEQYSKLLRNDDYEKVPELLRGLQPVKAFSNVLPSAEDHETHTTELAIDPLPAGFYVVLMSGNAGFEKGNNHLCYVMLQASTVSMILQNGRSMGFVLDRKTGLPQAGAQLEFYRQEWVSGKYVMRKMQSTTSGTDGSFKVTGNNQYFNQVVIRYKGDVLYTLEGLSTYQRGREHTTDIRTSFFTDRSIYRPGQTIYFKGIVLKREQNGRKVSVVPGTANTVTFYDANGQKIKSLELKTNEWGSVSGSFTAPQSGLTGNMRIGNEWGDTYVSVEEYKRPKFAVSFDTLKGVYALNETIRVGGKATAYAGNVIDHASVKYRVTRVTHFPYPWLYYRMILPSAPEMEIANGTVQTDEKGQFNLAFIAKPDETVDTSLLPRFTYNIEATVTDEAGETRSTSTSVSAGYRGIQIVAALPEMSRPQDLDTLQVRIANLNGQAVSQKATISIAPLQAPATPLRARRWTTPDQYVIDETTFRKNFPLDEYKKESKPEEWSAGAPVYEQSFTSNESGQLRIPAGTFRNGWYLITIKAKDKSSNAMVEERKYIQVWDGTVAPQTPLASLTDKDNYEPGETARAVAASGYATAHIIQIQNDATDRQELTGLSYNGTPKPWTRKLTDADRGGIGLQWIMVKENRVYTTLQTINVPWTNKDLDISWETHRDKLQPGAKETWTMVVRGSKKEKVAAEMVAGLYDASLDAFKPHSWNMYGLYPTISNYLEFSKEAGFGIAYNRVMAAPESEAVGSYDKTYEQLILIGQGYAGTYYHLGGGRSSARHMYLPEVAADASARRPRGEMAVAANAAPPSPMMKKETEESTKAGIGLATGYEGKDAGIGKPADTQNPPPLRKNLQETAFFYPQLQTDAQGNVRISFTMPEALTEWKFMALAHTKDMAFGQLGGKVKTQKDLMVQPNLPRFFRQGDDLVIAAKISNLSREALTGTATLEIVDAQTLQVQNLPFGIRDAKTTFSVAADQSTTATWRIHVPESRYEPVLIRISAQAGSFTDGEENMLPVLTNRMMVTETLPLWMNGAGTKSFRFDKLLQSGASKTLSQYRLTLEYTPNPAWYAVQALPYLMEYPYECAEQTFNRYYANALAAHILDKAPRVKQVFDTWKNVDTAALQSNLEKNQELKSALLEETPWVLQAQSETQQKHNIALLFDSYKLSRSQDGALKKLEEMLSSEGAFPWFKGMSADRYITQYIATGIARLQHLGVEHSRSKALSGSMRSYLDRKVTEDYEALIRSKAKLEDQQISFIHVQYLYLRSFDPGSKANEKNETAFNYYKKQAARYWLQFNPYLQGMIAIALHRLGDATTAQNIVHSLRENAVHKEELGMYWTAAGDGYWWYQAPIETQALLIECFKEVANDNAAVDEMKRWLLKQKQTQNWRTTKATADACYALLLNGTQWLENAPQVSIQLGKETVRPDKSEAGTGYFKQAFNAAEVKPEMGNISVQVAAPANNTGAASWGAVYWQYFESMDKITSATTPLTLRKQLFIEWNTDRGPVLEEIHDGNELKVGDKVKVRIVLQSDRDMEYLHLKDMRAACFEPQNVLSGYRWGSGLGYYESTRDASSNFFISYLRKGTYVFEYPVNVMAKGNFSNGIATIQCMYAPEFSSHSEGIRVEVK